MNERQAVKIADELSDRSEAMVFGLRRPDGTVTFRMKDKALWILNLGLATRLRSEAVCHVIERKSDPVEELTQSYPPLGDTDLRLAQTDELLAELCRVTPGEWVLGLLRPGRSSSRWTGLIWRGHGVICAGLASLIAEYIAQRILAEGAKEDPDTPELQRAAAMLGAVLQLGASDGSECADMVGMLHLSERIIHRHANQGSLPKGDLKEFVRIN